MNVLPQQPPKDPQASPHPISSIGMGKEVEQASTTELLIDVENSKDIELTKEVSAIGVSIKPTSIVLPKIVQNAGVQVANPVVQPYTIASTIVVPLSDDQIAKGLHESVLSSVRWLAQWCQRRLQQMQKTYARSSI